VSVRATPYRNLQAVDCVGRLPDPTTVFAGTALLANVCNQSEHEALAARCLATWPSLIREGGGEGKRYDRGLVEAGGCGSQCCSPAQVGSVERRTVRAGAGGWHMDGTRLSAWKKMCSELHRYLCPRQESNLRPSAGTSRRSPQYSCKVVFLQGSIEV
jgi:hypothetical protein